MSEFELSVGACYDERRRRICISHLEGLGLDGNNSALEPETHQPVKSFLLLNVATVCTFTDYVSELVGRPTGDLMNDDSFANLPYWEDCLWAPSDFTPSKAFAEDQDGPFFFGSNPRLLATLNHIKSISRIPFGPVPPGYDLMLSDRKAFYKSFNGLDGEQSCIQWVWRGLHDAATLAVHSRLPMLGIGL